MPKIEMKCGHSPTGLSGLACPRKKEKREDKRALAGNPTYSWNIPQNVSRPSGREARFKNSTIIRGRPGPRTTDRRCGHGWVGCEHAGDLGSED